jgi:transglutaminase-like putative cysteine protease
MRANPETRHWTLTPQRTLWITGCMVLVMIPHAARIPVWVAASFTILAGWRVANATRRVPLPPKWLVIVLSASMLTAVYASYGTLFGRNAGVALLAVLAGLKLLESRRLRDAYVLSALGYFLVITNFLYSQSILTGVYMMAVVLLMTATLIAFSTESCELDASARLRMAAGMLLQATPIMLILFFLFPRLPGPLWGLPRDARNAVSGLSESMSPGRISRLSLSDAVAFRVKFQGKAPATSQLYWRGPVLWHTDGRQWTGGQPTRSWRAQYVELQGQPVDYTITIEPHQKTWLFALDVPTTVPRGAQMTQDFQLRTPKPVRTRLRYQVRSFPEARLSRVSIEEQTAALALPSGMHPQARALALDWREVLPDDDAIVARALEYFRRQPFVYTLTPPLLKNDPVDEFLFETRSGFCESYASSFTVLMRAAGIPARIVTGYQGGELNPLGDYLIVRQRDAHAWTEVWLEDRGWVRVDPTGAVSPNRIQLGMDAAIPPTMGPAGLDLPTRGPLWETWRRWRYGIDAIKAGWNEWILGYGTRRQHELLALLGVDAGNLRALSMGMLAITGVMLGILALWLARRRPLPADPVSILYRRFCAKLARAGVTRRACEGPLDFAARAVSARPPLREPVERITGMYVALRYAGRDIPMGEFKRAVSAFRPRRDTARSHEGL